jgi:hypothetical protein
MSSGGQLSSVTSGTTRSPPVALTASGFSATRTTSNGEGSSRRRSSCSRVTEKTSYGPQKSKTSTSGKITIPTGFPLHLSASSHIAHEDALAGSWPQ